MNNFFKIDHRYNTKPHWMTELPHSDRSKSADGIHRSASEIIAAASLKTEKPRPTLNPTAQSSYHDKINQVLTEYQQLEKEKKLYHQKQQMRLITENKQRDSDFDRLMEEDLGNQLKELERQEKEQYKLMEQLLEEQFEQEHQDTSMDDLEKDHLEHLKQLQELDLTIEEQELFQGAQFKKTTTWRRHQQASHLEQFKKYQKQQQQQEELLNKKKSGKINGFYHQQNCTLMNIDKWNHSYDMYLKQIMSKVNSMKKDKIMRLLKAYYRTKKYYTQASK